MTATLVALPTGTSTSKKAAGGGGMADLGVLVDQYLQHRMRLRTLSWASMRNHRSHLAKFVEAAGGVQAEELSIADVERWLETRRDLAASSRRGQFSSVKVFCGWLVRAGYLATNPALGIDAPRLPRTVCRAMPEEDVALLLEHVPDARGTAIVWLMVGMGLRCCEVQNLELGDWNRRSAEMTVRGKGSHERVVPVPEEVTAAVVAYLQEYPTSAGPLIRSYRRPRSALSADALSGMVSEWMRAAGIKRRSRDGVSAHALRATAASDVLDNCHDLRVVREMLGHQHLATTDIYLRRSTLPQMHQAMAGRKYRSTRPPEQPTLFEP